MTPEERASRIFEFAEGLDAIQLGDTFALERLIAAAIRQAVADERERCAKEAELDAVDFVWKECEAGMPITAWVSQAIGRTATRIARRIREGGAG